MAEPEQPQIVVSFLEPLKTVHETRSEEVFGMSCIPHLRVVQVADQHPSPSIRRRDPCQIDQQGLEVRCQSEAMTQLR